MEIDLCGICDFVRVLMQLKHARNSLTCFRSEHDQELDSLLVGPIPVGVNKFIFEADPPDLRRIPTSEILGVTVILLTCSYDGREFVRVGYYVNNEYDSEELNAEPPAKPDTERVRRNVLAEKPRVTRFAIKWYVCSTESFTVSMLIMNRDTEDSAPAEFPPEQPEADTVEDDGVNYGAEEVELEEGLRAELAAAEASKEGEDEEMAGADDTAGAKDKDDDDDDDDAGSEDLEAESSGSEDEDAEEEEVEGEVDDDLEMGDGEHAEGSNADKQQAMHQQPNAEVLVHC